MTSLDPQPNYLVAAQLLTRILFLLLRVFHTINFALQAEATVTKPVWF